MGGSFVGWTANSKQQTAKGGGKPRLPV